MIEVFQLQFHFKHENRISTPQMLKPETNVQ